MSGLRHLISHAQFRTKFTAKLIESIVQYAANAPIVDILSAHSSTWRNLSRRAAHSRGCENFSIVFPVRRSEMIFRLPNTVSISSLSWLLIYLICFKFRNSLRYYSITYLISAFVLTRWVAGVTSISFPLSPHCRESGPGNREIFAHEIWNPENFFPWNPKSWALDSGTQL